MCNLSKEKISHFSFSLTHTLTLFLSISSHGLHFSKWLFVFCSLWNSHTIWPNCTLASALCFSSAHNKAEWPLLSFFFCSVSFNVSHTVTRLSHCPRKWQLTLEHFSLRSQTSPCFAHFSLNEETCIEDFWNKLLNEL